jgi:hypothetical protein
MDELNKEFWKSPEVSPETPTPRAEGPPEQAAPPEDFRGKLLGWLGKFHPATTHFPLALPLAAAAAAVALVTGFLGGALVFGLDPCAWPE